MQELRYVSDVVFNKFSISGSPWAIYQFQFANALISMYRSAQLTCCAPMGLGWIPVTEGVIAS